MRDFAGSAAAVVNLTRAAAGVGNAFDPLQLHAASADTLAALVRTQQHAFWCACPPPLHRPDRS